MDRKEAPEIARVTEGSLEMKALLISFVVGVLVGFAYGVIRVSPAPPIVALVGLLGMVLGEQVGDGFWQRRSRLQPWRQASSSVNAKISRFFRN